MSFFNKLKKGVSDTTALAKVTVEINRLKLQVSSKKKEISEFQTNIGVLVYEQYTDTVDRQDEIAAICDQIQEKYSEIETILEKIGELSDEKKCVCGSTVARSTRFCPECGHKFTETESQSMNNKQELALEAPAEAEASDDSSVLATAEEGSVQQCPKCAESLEVDAKFCGNCGTTVQLT